MYFSVLPLLILLFASAICSSPVHVEHRSTSVSAAPINRRGMLMCHTLRDLQEKYKDNKGGFVLQVWRIIATSGQRPVWSPDDNAWKMEREVKIDGMKCTLLEYTGNADANIASIMGHINYPQHVNQLRMWAWDVSKKGKLRIIFAKVLQDEHAATGH